MTERRLPQTAVENLVEDLASKANADLSNLDATGQAKFDAKANISLTNSPYTTNRILEIPQDIKLELNDGTLTLKAGSKVYVPNGFEADGTTPKFDIVTIESDVTETRSFNTNYKLQHFYDVSNSFFGNPFQVGFNLFSGNTAPSGFQTQINLWYDTSANLMKYTSDNGSTWSVVNYSLPLCVFSSPTIITSINQVFNGFGYIGSTVFALPGVKCQIPNGRNEDGSCKNRLYTVASVKTFTTNSDWGASVFHGYIGDLTDYGGSQYDFFPAMDSVTKLSEKNLYLDIVTGRYNSWCPVVSFYQDSTGKITSFTHFAVDSVVNSNLSNLSAAGQAKFDAKADKNIPVIGIPATSGAVTLADNTVYSGTMAGEMTFVLPTVTDATQYHQIKAMLYLPVVTINWGTTHYIGGEAPDVSEAGQYMIYWDYVPALSAWAVGAMKVV